MRRTVILTLLIFSGCSAELCWSEEAAQCMMEDEDEKKVCILATEGFNDSDLIGIVFSYNIFGDDFSRTNQAKQQLESMGLKVRIESSGRTGPLLSGASYQSLSVSDLQTIRKAMVAYSLESRSGMYTGWHTDRSQEILRNLEQEKSELKVKMQTIAADALCYVNSDCIAEPIGKKGCGGPKGYVIVPKSLQHPGSTWSMYVNRTYEIDKKLNFLKYRVSDCGYNSPPEQLRCSHSRCEATINPERSRRNYLK